MVVILEIRAQNTVAASLSDDEFRERHGPSAECLLSLLMCHWV